MSLANESVPFANESEFFIAEMLWLDASVKVKRALPGVMVARRQKGIAQLGGWAMRRGGCAASPKRSRRSCAPPEGGCSGERNSARMVADLGEDARMRTMREEGT